MLMVTRKYDLINWLKQRLTSIVKLCALFPGTKNTTKHTSLAKSLKIQTYNTDSVWH